MPRAIRFLWPPGGGRTFQRIAVAVLAGLALYTLVERRARPAWRPVEGEPAPASGAYHSTIVRPLCVGRAPLLFRLVAWLCFAKTVRAVFDAAMVVLAAARMRGFGGAVFSAAALERAFELTVIEHAIGAIVVAPMLFFAGWSLLHARRVAAAACLGAAGAYALLQGYWLVARAWWPPELGARPISSATGTTGSVATAIELLALVAAGVAARGITPRPPATARTL